MNTLEPTAMRSMPTILTGGAITYASRIRRTHPTQGPKSSSDRPGLLPDSPGRRPGRAAVGYAAWLPGYQPHPGSAHEVGSP